MQSYSFAPSLWSSVLLLFCAAAASCAPRLELGSNVIWATDHESGDLEDWSADGGGALLLDDFHSTAEISTEFSHSGEYSLKLTDLAPMSDSEGPGVYRELRAPPDAYYSAWYYLPRLYKTNSQWTIQKFRSRSDSDLEQVNHGHDLNLRTLPGGQVVLYIYSHDPAYLQAPLVDPPAYVPVETWFQIETFFSARTDRTGQIRVWLDDRLVYDLGDRRTTGSDDVLWTPCNIGQDVQPSPPILFLDDAGISRVRVTREGWLVPRP
jgi:hypothetical protein